MRNDTFAKKYFDLLRESDSDYLIISYTPAGFPAWDILPLEGVWENQDEAIENLFSTGKIIVDIYDLYAPVFSRALVRSVQKSEY